MQGYFQIASFDVPPMNGEPDEFASVDYIVISRRSRDRAGLRYQRRGVGEEGNVANFVETESIARVQASQSWLPGCGLPKRSFVTAGRPDECFQPCPASRLKYVAVLLRSTLSTDSPMRQFQSFGISQGTG